uniref:Voltage-dependent T-type calcium channel subunit alpha-1G n=2 Tax=Cacopsylla melanoneura TaxID=428564 RepID=A0A8D8V082_9HEMI
MSMKHSVYRGGYPARNMQPDPESDIQEYSDFEDLDQGSEEETDEEEGEEDEDCEEEEDLEEEEDPALQLPYPGFIPISLKYLDQTSRPRNWCLRMITNPWFERISMLVILLNCVTLGMYQPCVDDKCITNRCKILQMFDDFIFVFFALEMTIKMIAMGCYGKGTYLADSWNRLDFFIVLAGALEYSMFMDNMNFTAIRTIRVLRPLRAINRIPSMRILVMLLLDTLPMLGNVLLLCFFVFFIFGIIGVQLWEGILRQRCFLKPLPNVTYPKNLPTYFQYKDQDKDYICSSPNDNGMHYCTDLPHYKLGDTVCNSTAKPSSNNIPTATDCVNWNQYYTECKSQGQNPFQGTISFDNIGLAWVAIFVVISLEGWVDIMYYVQDAHSFWDWIYFVLLIVIGSFFMINLCLVVIATQFSETKKREMERMKMERARYHSTSTLTSSTNNSEPNTCYAEMVKYVAHLYRRSKRRLIKKWRLYKYQRQLKREEKLAQSLPGAPSAAPPGVPVFDLRVQNNDIHADLSRKCTNNNNDSVSVDITSHTNNNNNNRTDKTMVRAPPPRHKDQQLRLVLDNLHHLLTILICLVFVKYHHDQFSRILEYVPQLGLVLDKLHHLLTILCSLVLIHLCILLSQLFVHLCLFFHFSLFVFQPLVQGVRSPCHANYFAFIFGPKLRSLVKGLNLRSFIERLNLRASVSGLDLGSFVPGLDLETFVSRLDLNFELGNVLCWFKIVRDVTFLNGMSGARFILNAF